MNRIISIVLVFGLLITAVPTVSATDDVIEENSGESVSCTYPESEIQNYQPEIVSAHLDIEPSSVYAGKFRSPDYGTDVYVYWAKYASQEGLTSEDSHYGDHEPVYVYVDDESGDIEKIQFSAYHYLKGEDRDPEMNGSHPVVRANNPYHHYSSQTLLSGTLYDTNNFCDGVGDWYDNGWEASKEAVAEPWSMNQKASWWKDNSFGFSATEQYWEARQTVSDLTGVLGDVF